MSPTSANRCMTLTSWITASHSDLKLCRDIYYYRRQGSTLLPVSVFSLCVWERQGAQEVDLHPSVSSTGCEWFPPIVPKSLAGGERWRMGREGGRWRGETGLPPCGFIHWDDGETNPHICPGTACASGLPFIALFLTHIRTPVHREALTSASFWIHVPCDARFSADITNACALVIKAAVTGFSSEASLPPFSICCGSLSLSLLFF